MVGDYATKPLQGALFKKFRDQIMGVEPVRDPRQGKVKPVSDKVWGKKQKSKSGSSSAGFHKVTKLVACVPPQHSLCALKKCGTTGNRGRACAATLTKTWKGQGMVTHEKINTQEKKQEKKQGLVPPSTRRHHRSVLGKHKYKGGHSEGARRFRAKTE